MQVYTIILCMSSVYCANSQIGIDILSANRYTFVMSEFIYLKLSGAIAQSGMTQKEISQKLGIHYNTVSGWANGRSPHPDKLYSLLFVLGWDNEQIEKERLVDWYTITAE